MKDRDDKFIDLTRGKVPGAILAMEMEVIAGYNEGTIIVTAEGLRMELTITRPEVKFETVWALIEGFPQIVEQGLVTLNDIEGNEVDRDS